MKKEINHVKRIENDYWQREIFEDDDNFSFIIKTGNRISIFILNKSRCNEFKNPTITLILFIAESSSDDDIGDVDDDYSDSNSGMSGIEELDSN